MNIFLHELKAYRKSTMIWTISLIMIIALYMSMYPSFVKESEQFVKIMESYPEAIRNALGMNLTTIFTILGYYRL
jgi:ABC-2 type transport system permease protein